ncbi:MAG: triose-phosphate isomerase [Patescibacteria group bacterium]
MRRPMVVGNWKMYTEASDAHVLATSIRNYVSNIKEIEIVLCPPIIWLSEILSIVGKGGRIELGAQNMFYEKEGPYTGEISPMMIKNLAKYVIIGHSERREHFGETNLDVNEKVIVALRAGLYPIICVGEKKKSVNYPTSVVNQLKEALAHVPKKYYAQVVIAYEPVWAIGTGENADPEYAAKVISQLRQLVLRDSPILYGGSVNSKNAAGFANRPEIDGLLVGGASLRASEFVKICSTWAEKKSFK